MHPTLMGWMLLPLLLFWRIMSGLTALLPDTNPTFILWDFVDSTAETIADVINDSIKNDTSPWDVI